MGSRVTITAPGMQSTLESLGFRGYEDFASCTIGEVVSSRGSAETRRISTSGAAGGGGLLYLKVYRHAPPSWRTLLQRDKCSIERRNYACMGAVCGVSVPEVVAFGARRSFGRLCDAFIMTCGVEGARPLDAWWDDCGGRDASMRSWALAASAACASAMHEAGFSHIDLQWRNLLVSESPRGERGIGRGAGEYGGHAETVDRRLFVLDSARGGMRWWSVRREHGRIRDLSSLSKGARGRLTRTEQLRWLCRYFGVERLGCEHRALVRTILRDRLLKDGGDVAMKNREAAR